MAFQFKYKAIAQDGSLQQGKFEAEDIDTVKKHLDSSGLIPVKVDYASQRGAYLRNLFQPSVNLTLLSYFTTKLITLIRTGIPLIITLDIISKEQEDERFCKALQKMKQTIEGGVTLSGAMEDFPQYFTPLYISAIQAAEASGQMDTILNRLHSLIEKEIRTKEMVKAAIRYPSYVMVIISLAILAMVTLVMPKFADFYKSFNAELPLPTKIIMEFSRFLSTYWYLAIAICIVLFFAFTVFRKSSFGRNVIDQIKLEAPIIGELFLEMILSRVCFILATLLKSGLPLIEALRLVGKDSGNSIITNVLLKMSDNVEEGKEMISPMRESKYFRPLIIQMIVIGLESGSLDTMLYEVANHYDKSVEYQSKKLTSRIEPLLTVFTAGIVMLLALAIFLPLWNMMSVLKQ
ncbi:MAG: type II secretion system F family protein [candidate division Zixibacteria bacterium]|nr:type II secretion system F family protein [candidate division Zixibacteria bacterium]